MNFNFAYTQVKHIQKGAYLNVVEFNNNTPSLNVDFKIKKVIENSNSIAKHPYSIVKTNLYKIRSNNKKVKNRMVNKKIWGIYDGENFYLNGYKYGRKGKGYFRILEMGKFAYFIGSPYIGKMPYQMQKNAVLFGAMGLAVASSIVEYKTMYDIYYVINMTNGMVHNLTSNYLYWILESEADIKEKYNKEIEKDKLEIKLNYLRQLNKRLEIK